MRGAGLPIFSDDLGLRSSENIERLISGASLPTENHMELMAEHYVLIPDTWGKFSNATSIGTFDVKNPS